MTVRKKIPYRAGLLLLTATLMCLLAVGCSGKSGASTAHEAMQAHIQAALESGHYPIFDGKSGKLAHLQFKKLHPKVKRKGAYFVSCADFVDRQGNQIDVDFIAAKRNGSFRVVQAWLHKRNKVKRPYNVTL